MKTLPSKELLSEVLGVYVRDGWYFDCELLIYTYDKISGLDENYHAEINIYELAHMCKEWTFKQGYELFSRILSNDNQMRGNCIVIRVESDPETTLTITNADTEPEAIFKASEWVLKDNK